MAPSAAVIAANDWVRTNGPRLPPNARRQRKSVKIKKTAAKLRPMNGQHKVDTRRRSCHRRFLTISMVHDKVQREAVFPYFSSRHQQVKRRKIPTEYLKRHKRKLLVVVPSWEYNIGSAAATARPRLAGNNDVVVGTGACSSSSMCPRWNSTKKPMVLTPAVRRDGGRR